MVAEKKKTKILVGLIALVLTAIAVVLIVYAVRNAKRPETPLSVTPRPAQEVVVREKEVEKIVTVEKEIDSAILTDGVRELGLLVTDEYYFTEVVSYSSVKKLWKFELPLTESSYLVSYDGVVRAGVDLGEASIEKDDERRLITVTLPPATNPISSRWERSSGLPPTLLIIFSSPTSTRLKGIIFCSFLYVSHICQ